MSLLFFSVLLLMHAAAPPTASAGLSAFEVRRIRKALRSAESDSRAVAPAQSEAPPPVSVPGESGLEFYVCPMHADFQRRAPAVCAVCGMVLQRGRHAWTGAEAGAAASVEITLSLLQADLLTLRFAEIRPLRIERWIRTSAARAGGGQLAGTLTGPDRAALRPGLLVRAFPMRSRTRVFSGRIETVQPAAAATRFAIRLADDSDDAEVYVTEIIVSEGTKLAIPSDAILFTTDGLFAFKRVRGDSEAITISQAPVRIGSRGEVYYEVLDGLEEGDAVAVSGLFFLDAAVKYGRAGAASAGRLAR